MIDPSIIFIARQNAEERKTALEMKIHNITYSISELDRRIRVGEEAKDKLAEVRKNLKECMDEYIKL